MESQIFANLIPEQRPNSVSSTYQVGSHGRVMVVGVVEISAVLLAHVHTSRVIDPGSVLGDGAKGLAP